MPRKFSDENEHVKRRYMTYMKEARGYDRQTVDKACAAILRFEEGIGFRSFKTFRSEQAAAFKARLLAQKNKRTGKPLSLATVDATLRAVKAFFHWLAAQPGYKSRIAYPDLEYFNLSMKATRIAHAKRDQPYPTMEQCRHAFDRMPGGTDLERRDRAIFACLMLTGARDGALASFRLKRVDLVNGCIHQDARDVKTKNAKTFTTWFFPVDEVYRTCFADWVTYLRTDLFFGNEDPLFPKPKIGRDESGFRRLGLSRDCYANAERVRAVVHGAFKAVDLPPFGPHRFRTTLTKYGDQVCTSGEQFKAWSLNLGHENVMTTLSSYCPVSSERQGELIRAMGAR